MAMMNRTNLQKILEGVLGSKNVYFQPPEGFKMKYPCIVYSRADIKNDYANNSVYRQMLAYTITVIDRKPDSEIVHKVSLLPFCSYDRHFTSANLNHDVFTLYY